MTSDRSTGGRVAQLEPIRRVFSAIWAIEARLANEEPVILAAPRTILACASGFNFDFRPKTFRIASYCDLSPPFFEEACRVRTDLRSTTCTPGRVARCWQQSQELGLLRRPFAALRTEMEFSRKILVAAATYNHDVQVMHRLGQASSAWMAVLGRLPTRRRLDHAAFAHSLFVGSYRSFALALVAPCRQAVWIPAPARRQRGDQRWDRERQLRQGRRRHADPHRSDAVLKRSGIAPPGTGPPAAKSNKTAVAAISSRHIHGAAQSCGVFGPGVMSACERMVL